MSENTQTEIELYRNEPTKTFDAHLFDPTAVVAAEGGDEQQSTRPVPAICSRTTSYGPFYRTTEAELDAWIGDDATDYGDLCGSCVRSYERRKADRVEHETEADTMAMAADTDTEHEAAGDTEAADPAPDHTEQADTAANEADAGSEDLTAFERVHVGDFVAVHYESHQSGRSQVALGAVEHVTDDATVIDTNEVTTSGNPRRVRVWTTGDDAGRVESQAARTTYLGEFERVELSPAPDDDAEQEAAA